MSSMEIAVYGVMAVYGVKEFLVPLVKTSFARNIQAKDDADKETKAKLESQEKDLAALKIAHAAASSSTLAELGNINGRLTALDTRIEKQGQSHDERLKSALSEVATEFNRRLTMMFNTELERVVRDVLREELKKKRA